MGSANGTAICRPAAGRDADPSPVIAAGQGFCPKKRVEPLPIADHGDGLIAGQRVT
jgi:hypothetical protein